MLCATASIARRGMGLATTVEMAMTQLFHRTPTDRALDEMLSLFAQRGLQDRCVFAAMTVVPRELFVMRGHESLAYADQPLPIGHGQTMSQPYVVALMIEALALSGDERVLEIGTGSGYSAAVLAQLAAHVYSIDLDPVLADTARSRLAKLGYRDITIKCGDGSAGWPEHAPYDAIIVASGAPSVPQPLIDQLAIGGHVVMPVGPHDDQRLMRLTRTSEKGFTVQDLGDVAFVGEFGWGELEGC
jgi:protein-L-isoaspartate(D-aspartate) O-methyltransferase